MLIHNIGINRELSCVDESWAPSTNVQKLIFKACHSRLKVGLLPISNFGQPWHQISSSAWFVRLADLFKFSSIRFTVLESNTFGRKKTKQKKKEQNLTKFIMSNATLTTIISYNDMFNSSIIVSIENFNTSQPIAQHKKALQIKGPPLVSRMVKPRLLEDLLGLLWILLLLHHWLFCKTWDET